MSKELLELRCPYCGSKVFVEAGGITCNGNKCDGSWDDFGDPSND